MVLTLVCSLFLQDSPKTDDDAIVFVPWDAWVRFEKGSWVRYRVESPSATITGRTVLQAKNEELILLQSVQKVKVGDGEFETEPTPIELKPPSSRPEPCATCKNLHRSNPKRGTEQLEVAGRKLRCVIVTDVVYDCQGKEIGRAQAWYSRDVPGWIVRMETTSPSGKVTHVCLEFEAKK